MRPRTAGATVGAADLANALPPELRLRDRHGYTGFRAANLVYGAFDLSMTPSQRAFGNERLVLRTKDIAKFRDAVDLERAALSERQLNEVMVDFHDDLNRRGFSISNPNAKTTCGCGSSFSM